MYISREAANDLYTLVVVHIHTRICVSRNLACLLLNAYFHLLFACFCFARWLVRALQLLHTCTPLGSHFYPELIKSQVASSHGRAVLYICVCVCV